MTDKRPKISEEGFRVCDQEGCESPASHTLFWTEGWYCGCIIHTQALVNLGNMLGHTAAAGTVRKMTIDEMMPEEA